MRSADLAARLGTLLLWLYSSSVAAHSASNSYMSLDLRPAPQAGQRFTGRWDIALRDLEYRLGIDRNRDGELSWGEVRAAHPAIAALALSTLVIGANGQACTARVGEQQLTRHSDGVHGVLPLSIGCAEGARPDHIDYSLLFDVDPGHRGLLRLDYPHAQRSFVLSPQRHALDLDMPGAGETSSGAEFVAFWREGVTHIWRGIDHLLFLLILFLPTVVSRGARAEQVPVPAFRRSAGEMLRIVTAFTVAHSITLSLAVFAWINPPARLVEMAIAASLLVAALNNLYGFLPGRNWAVAFVLGLIHGFGFANALAETDLSSANLVTALAGFNLGVESGQLAVVIIVMPLLYSLRKLRFYRRSGVRFASILIAMISLVWLLERGLDRNLLAL